MGYGGIINKVVDPFGIGDTPGPKTPNPTRVGKDYLGLINAFAQGAPTVFATEQTYRPKYNDLDLAELSRISPEFTKIMGANAGSVSDMIRGINPMQTDLLDQLGKQASDELGRGAELDPGLARVFQQSTRGAQASRGLGFGPSDVFDESMGLTQLGNTLRQQRRDFAGGVTAMNNQFVTQPALTMLNQIPNTAEAISRGAGPTVIPSNQSYDAFNTAYNARAASNIAGANNAAAANNSY